MARAFDEAPAAVGGAAASGSGTDLRRVPPEQNRRYRELADKLDREGLSVAERRELEALVEQSEQMMLENSHALLQRQDPSA